MDERLTRVEELLREAADLHHRTYRITDGDDPDWASFYADWLVNRSELPDICGAPVVRSELVHVLVKLDEAPGSAVIGVNPGDHLRPRGPPPFLAGRRRVSSEYDVICLGAGPAGEALTNELKGSGLTVAVLEKHLVGGECAYYGCMPSKAMLRAAETLGEATRARTLAASRVQYSVDYPKVHKRVSMVARDLDDKGAEAALQKVGAEVLRGEGRLVGPRDVDLDGRRLTARKAVVIATGTAPAMPPIDGLDAVEVWTNREAVLAPELPASLVVIGGGAVGVELAQAFRRLGSEVHIIENGARPIAVEEPEAGEYLQERLVAEGIHVTTRARAERIRKVGAEFVVDLGSGEKCVASGCWSPPGARPTSRASTSPRPGSQSGPRGWVNVDAATLEAADGIYAGGDVTGLGGFTHLAYYHGLIAARRIKGEDARADHRAIPRVTFTDPEVASVGASESRAREDGLDVLTASVNVADTSRGYCIHGDPGGVIKLVADASRKTLVGATVVSPRAGEIIGELTLAVRAAVPLLDTLRDTVHAFPTFSRALGGLLADLK